MSTIREQILVAMKNAADTTTGMSGKVFRTRLDAASRAEAPVIFMEPVADVATQTTLPRLDWSMVVRFKVLACGNIPDQVADPIVDSLHNKILTDLTLQSLVVDVQPSNVNFVFSSSDNNSVMVICDYKVTYKTSQNNLSTLN